MNGESNLNDISGVAAAAAAQLHAELQATLFQPQPVGKAEEADARVQAMIAQAVALNTQLIDKLQVSAPHDDLDEQSAAGEARLALLCGELQAVLDETARSLAQRVDEAAKLLDATPALPPGVTGEQIVRYSSTLRHAFAPLGEAQGQWQVPPAPQVPHMLHSTLRLYNRELAQQQAVTATAEAVAQPSPPRPTPVGASTGGGSAAVPLAVPAAVAFQLNADLDDGLVTTSEDSDLSQDSYSDD